MFRRRSAAQHRRNGFTAFSGLKIFDSDSRTHNIATHTLGEGSKAFSPISVESKLAAARSFSRSVRC